MNGAGVFPVVVESGKGIFVDIGCLSIHMRAALRASQIISEEVFQGDFEFALTFVTQGKGGEIECRADLTASGAGDGFRKMTFPVFIAEPV